MLASGSAASLTTSAASYTSKAPRSAPPVKLSITPVAPSIEVSSNGDAIASCTASAALLSPLPCPTPM